MSNTNKLMLHNEKVQFKKKVFGQGCPKERVNL